MSNHVIEVNILPITLEVDGVRVHLLEALKSKLPDGKTIYHAVVKVDYHGIISRQFDITFSTNEEFREKLRTEIAKIKLMDFLYGREFVKGVISD